MNLNKKKNKSIRLKIANSYIISSISITFVLLVLGFFSLLLLNTKDLSNAAKQSVKLSVILKPDAEQGQIEDLQGKISAADYTDEVVLVTPDDAMDLIKEDLGDDIDDILDYNPLPYTMNITLMPEYANTDSIQVLESRFLKSDIISEVIYNRPLVYQLDKNIKKLTIATIFLELLL